MNSRMSATVTTCPHLSPTEQDRTGENSTGVVERCPLATPPLTDSTTHNVSVKEIARGVSVEEVGS